MGQLTEHEGGPQESVVNILTTLHGQLGRKQLFAVNGEKLNRWLQSEHGEVGSETDT